MTDCKYCGSKMDRCERAYAENPFCSGCRDERIDMSIKAQMVKDEAEGKTWELRVCKCGEWTHFVRVDKDDQG